MITITVGTVLVICSAICFLLAVLKVDKINFIALGLLLFVLSFLFH